MFIEYLLYYSRIYCKTLVHRKYLSLIWTPQPRRVPSRLNQNGHLTNTTTLPWVNYVRYMG